MKRSGRLSFVGVEGMAGGKAGRQEEKMED